jgi:GDSL-like Lipase/Acylhydrolase family
MTLNSIFRKLFRSDSSPGFFSHYFALGDSISTDDYPGEGKGAASLFFKNQDHLYPDFRGKDLHSLNRKMDFQLLARDGATSHDILHNQLQSLQRGSMNPIIFTLTSGGNDILSLQSDSAEIAFRIEAILKFLKHLFPNGVVLLGTIYDPSDGTGELFDQGSLQHKLDILLKTNQAIRTMTEPGRVYLVDIYQHFLGHGMKAALNQNSEMSTDASVWYVNNIEPNSRGAHEIRNLFWKALGQNLQDRDLAKQASS